MALELSSGICFRKNDEVQVTVGTTTINGIVANAGEGYMSPYEDMYYLMSAPHQGVKDLLSEENEIWSAHALVAVKCAAIPFPALPVAVELRSVKGDPKPVAMNALAIIGGKEASGDYLIYLEIAGEK